MDSEERKIRSQSLEEFFEMIERRGKAEDCEIRKMARLQMREIYFEHPDKILRMVAGKSELLKYSDTRIRIHEYLIKTGWPTFGI